LALEINKSCVKCSKLLTKRNKSGYCRICFQHSPNKYAKSRTWDKANAERRRENQRRWRTQNADYIKTQGKQWQLLNTYGITLDEYYQLLTAQDNSCGICRRHKSKFRKMLAVDHCHKTGNVRGLLCFSCNRAIAYLQDNAEYCDAAATYLRR
jgi:hypothetical protein